MAVEFNLGQDMIIFKNTSLLHVAIECNAEVLEHLMVSMQALKVLSVGSRICISLQYKELQVSLIDKNTLVVKSSDKRCRSSNTPRRAIHYLDNSGLDGFIEQLEEFGQFINK